MQQDKKAFTLTELLVVVVIIGVLSAVAVPRFTRAVETRKTAEAEKMMAAVRTEQEKRCTLDKHYVTSFTALGSLVSSENTDNFSYSLTPTGINATRKGNNGYTLQIPSYHDGRICCESEEACLKLNKNYPLCSELIARADFRSAAQCIGQEEAECSDGQTSGSQSCNGCGLQTTQICSGGKWVSSLGSCSKTAAECNPPPAAECAVGSTENGSACGNCGVQVRTCGADGKWGGWICSGQGECAAGTTQEEGCGDGSVVRTRTCSAQCAWASWDETACNECRPSLSVPKCPGTLTNLTSGCYAELNPADYGMSPEDPNFNLLRNITEYEPCEANKKGNRYKMWDFEACTWGAWKDNCQKEGIYKVIANNTVYCRGTGVDSSKVDLVSRNIKAGDSCTKIGQIVQSISCGQMPSLFSDSCCAVRGGVEGPGTPSGPLNVAWYSKCGGGWGKDPAIHSCTVQSSGSKILQCVEKK